MKLKRCLQKVYLITFGLSNVLIFLLRLKGVTHVCNYLQFCLILLTDNYKMEQHILDANVGKNCLKLTQMSN
jgi:hypothetical protein